MDELTQLAVKYKADKWGKHHYTPAYFSMFADREKEVKKVVEIGIGEGASLRMWRDFFPNATIYGADIDPDRMKRLSKRMVIVKCDQTKARDLINLTNETGKDIDLFVDDGSHHPVHQVFTCLTIMRLINKEVTYVIEDVAEDIVVTHLKQVRELHVEEVRVGNRYDDRLVIVRHKHG